MKQLEEIIGDKFEEFKHNALKDLTEYAGGQQFRTGGKACCTTGMRWYNWTDNQDCDVRQDNVGGRIIWTKINCGAEYNYNAQCAPIASGTSTGGWGGPGYSSLEPLYKRGDNKIYAEPNSWPLLDWGKPSSRINKTQNASNECNCGC
jgi:hypothetical protein